MAPLSNAPERWCIQRTADRFGVADEWADILASTHVGFDVRFTHRTPKKFQGTVVRRRFGELTLVDCVCTPFSGRHDVLMGGVGESAIGFQTVRRGAERIRYASGEHVVTSGEAILWDGAHPVDVEVVEPFVKRTLIFPRDRVLAVCPRLADLQALPSLGESPSTRLLVRYLDALADELPGLAAGADSAVSTATDVALELLRAAVEPGLPGSKAAARDALRADIRRYIRVHLQDPGLGPESIARAHAISLRSLHSLFEDTGESVAAFVRKSRLARCRAELEQPGASTVTEIAFRWGFSDAAHFSNVFKREYGQSPREVRRAAATRMNGQVIPHAD
ncbi:helix-turn-helix domain-containing protein [Saccharopolyspora sp. K220]|uniref:helix-turn-helix domain-containing protein n=1 Tax=Saccharopolyspora soli TaxID=2926618 RepID=UPI001F564CB3|nr:helix-turn-helix domain-containing protein [Saccharopolyspora soli]MCI2415938.1 helix-turn-helix domain-containing protein [Saccharopolyspora soli]